MTEGKKVRWFAIPVPTWGWAALGDMVTASIVTLEHLMVPLFDLVGAALSALLGAGDILASTDPTSAQKIVRKQDNRSDYELLEQIAAENGWDMLVEHGGLLGGRIAALHVVAGSPDTRLHAALRRAR